MATNRQRLNEDIASEKKAAHDYTTRIKQFEGTSAATVLREIRADEQDHRQKLERLVKRGADTRPLLPGHHRKG